MGKTLKKPKLKKLKVKKLRGGGMDMGNAANQAQSASMAGGDGGVQRDTGLERQRQANITAQANKPTFTDNIKKAADVVGMFMNPVTAVAKYGYSQFKKGQQNKMDYEGQAAGVTPMSSPRTTYATNTGGGKNTPTTTVSNTVAPKSLFANNPTNVAASNFMVRPGVRLAPLSTANMPKASSQGFMLKPGVALSDVAKASNGKLIKGHPKLAKKGWK
jgi:hypothetical protein